MNRMVRQAERCRVTRKTDNFLKKIPKNLLTNQKTSDIIKTDKTKEDKKMTEYMEMVLAGADLEDLFKEAGVDPEEFEEA